MHSMIGSAGGPGGGHGAGQLYGEHQPTSGFATFGLGVHGDDDVGSVFFQSQAYGAGADAGGDLITDYLQGFLDPAGLARHFDATPCDRTNDVVKPGSAAGDVTGHDGRHSQPGDAAAVAPPNSSTSSEPRRGKKGRPALEEGDEEGEVDEEGSVPDHQNSRSDVKKQKKGKVEKKARGSRVAFATKSEVDHLDDGYRWRKYGQKAVKNSSFPRSYYRCTAARCGVKKQVERSQQDPSTVVTTYEGQHAHPSPYAHRGPMAAGANGLYSLASLQQQRHGFCPSSPDDLLLGAAARAMAPPAAAASLVALLPRQDEHRFAEYYGMQLKDVLLDPLADIEHGHR